jgi:hypothetical protein
MLEERQKRLSFFVRILRERSVILSSNIKIFEEAIDDRGFEMSGGKFVRTSLLEVKQKKTQTVSHSRCGMMNSEILTPI